MTFGDTIEDLVPRNAFYGDGLRNVDLALSKVFRLPWSGDDLSVRIEGFNVFNQKQFGFPDHRTSTRQHSVPSTGCRPATARASCSS